MTTLQRTTVWTGLMMAIAAAFPVESHAGFCDWLFGPRTVHRPVTTYYPSTAYYAPAPVATAYAPPVYAAQYAPQPVAPVVAQYAPVPYAPALVAAPTGVPVTAAPANTALYAPQTPAYDTKWVQVPVTYYRPMNAVDPTTGSQVTIMQPCTSYEWRATTTPGAAAPVAAYPPQTPVAYPAQPPAAYPAQPSATYPAQPPTAYQAQPPATYPAQPPVAYPAQPPVTYPGQPPANYQAAPYQNGYPAASVPPTLNAPQTYPGANGSYYPPPNSALSPIPPATTYPANPYAPGNGTIRNPSVTVPGTAPAPITVPGTPMQPGDSAYPQGSPTPAPGADRLDPADMQPRLKPIEKSASAYVPPSYSALPSRPLGTAPTGSTPATTTTPPRTDFNGRPVPDPDARDKSPSRPLFNIPKLLNPRDKTASDDSSKKRALTTIPAAWPDKSQGTFSTHGKAVSDQGWTSVRQ